MTPRQARIGVDIFTGLVVASVGVALAGLTWRLLGDPGTRYGAAPVAALAGQPIDLAPIIAAAPFGTGGGTGGAAGAPMTNQPLVLRGIVLADPRSASTALIQIGDAPPVAFAIGQAAGATTIEAIERDHVVLVAGGQRQILAFPRKPDPGSAVAPVPVAVPATPTVAPPPPLASGGSAAAFLQNLGAAPSGDGFRVNGGSSIGRLAGLQPGDQIERINGRAVADIARDPNAYATISAAGAARLELVRAGQRLTLIVPLR